MESKLSTVLLISIFSIIAVSGFVDEKCKADDEDCINSAAKSGYKKVIEGDSSLDAEYLEPVYVELNEGYAMGLKYKFTDCNLAGFTNCSMMSASIDPEAKNLKTEIFCPYLELYGKYSLSGRLLLIKDVYGDGDFKIECTNYTIITKALLNSVPDSDGNEVLNIKNHLTNAFIKSGRLVFHFDNLYNGDEKASKEAHDIANNNWRLMAQVFTPTVIYPHMDKIVMNANKFLHTIPSDDVFKND